MRKIELVSGIYSSALGFGCAPILGSANADKAKRALETALDCGINHFDLARSYGYGEAERFVGNVIKGNREKMILASKFGIKANWKARMLRPVKPVARLILDKIKKAAPVSAGSEVNKPRTQVADKLHDRILLTPREMQKSLNESLKALQTDYLDYFFIHEPLHQIENIDDLTQAAHKLKQEGKIRAWGLAYMRHQQELHTSYLSHFDILQFDNSPGAQGYDSSVTVRGTMPNILFSPLRGGDPGMKPADKLLTLAKDFPTSVILCSMFNEQHMRNNAQLFE